MGQVVNFLAMVGNIEVKLVSVTPNGHVYEKSKVVVFYCSGSRFDYGGPSVGFYNRHMGP